MYKHHKIWNLMLKYACSSETHMAIIENCHQGHDGVLIKKLCIFLGYFRFHISDIQ